jgi:hypothetical protein
MRKKTLLKHTPVFSEFVLLSFGCHRHYSHSLSSPSDGDGGGLESSPEFSEWSCSLVTLAGYCVHSTLVPAIVPFFYFLRQLSKSTGRENFLPMVGGALERGGNEGQDRRKIRNQPTIFFLFFSNFPTNQKSTFWPLPLCVSGFLGL